LFVLEGHPPTTKEQSMPQNVNPIVLDWGNPTEKAAKFSNRARRVVEKLLAKGCDPMDIEIYTGDKATGQDCDAAGWFYIGRTKWGTGKTIADPAYKFAHRTYARVCYIVAYLDGVEVAISLSQNRYGNGGKVRPQPIEVGAPIETQTFTGIVTEGERPRAARAILNS
jgi:hypothetical protein